MTLTELFVQLESGNRKKKKKTTETKVQSQIFQPHSKVTSLRSGPTSYNRPRTEKERVGSGWGGGRGGGGGGGAGRWER